MLGRANACFNQERVTERFRKLVYGALTCLGRHTVSGMLTASGQQFIDWSASYRVFSQNRLKADGLFEISKKEVLSEIESNQLLVAHMDDTIIKKTGKKIPGASWRRDPLGPPFHTNFIWGQRFLQISLALPSAQGPCQSRAIPVDFHHCPTPKRPARNASQPEIEAYKEQGKQLNLSIQGAGRIKKLRDSLDMHGARDRELFLSVDGSYTNANVLKNLPRGVTLIGRIRKDTRLHKLPEHCKHTGRKKIYGEQIPTPEQIRTTDQIPWKEVKGWAAGREHIFKVKVVKDLRWGKAGGGHTMQLVIISPLRYRLSKASRLLYREPAYLLCTDTQLDVDKLLQAYLWRWEIEVNFRDEKTMLGAGKAQVRNEFASASMPAFTAAIYSYLLIAAHRAYKNLNRDTILPRPKWYPASQNQRLTTNEIINLLRTQLWAKALGCSSFNSFVEQEKRTRSHKNESNPLSSAVFYMRN